MIIMPSGELIVQLSEEEARNKAWDLVKAQAKANNLTIDFSKYKKADPASVAQLVVEFGDLITKSSNDDDDTLLNGVKAPKSAYNCAYKTAGKDGSVEWHVISGGGEGKGGFSRKTTVSKTRRAPAKVFGFGKFIDSMTDTANNSAVRNAEFYLRMTDGTVEDLGVLPIIYRKNLSDRMKELGMDETDANAMFNMLKDPETKFIRAEIERWIAGGTTYRADVVNPENWEKTGDTVEVFHVETQDRVNTVKIFPTNGTRFSILEEAAETQSSETLARRNRIMETTAMEEAKVAGQLHLIGHAQTQKEMGAIRALRSLQEEYKRAQANDEDSAIIEVLLARIENYQTAASMEQTAFANANQQPRQIAE
jgi:uncharacterized protein YqfB (UPF0267 family)